MITPELVIQQCLNLRKSHHKGISFHKVQQGHIPRISGIECLPPEVNLRVACSESTNEDHIRALQKAEAAFYGKIRKRNSKAYASYRGDFWDYAFNEQDTAHPHIYYAVVSYLVIRGATIYFINESQTVEKFK